MPSGLSRTLKAKENHRNVVDEDCPLSPLDSDLSSSEGPECSKTVFSAKAAEPMAECHGNIQEDDDSYSMSEYSYSSESEVLQQQAAKSDTRVRTFSKQKEFSAKAMNIHEKETRTSRIQQVISQERQRRSKTMDSTMYQPRSWIQEQGEKEEQAELARRIRKIDRDKKKGNHEIDARGWEKWPTRNASVEEFSGNEKTRRQSLRKTHPALEASAEKFSTQNGSASVLERSANAKKIHDGKTQADDKKSHASTKRQERPTSTVEDSDEKFRRLRMAKEAMLAKVYQKDFQKETWQSDKTHSYKSPTPSPRSPSPCQHTPVPSDNAHSSHERRSFPRLGSRCTPSPSCCPRSRSEATPKNNRCLRNEARSEDSRPHHPKERTWQDEKQKSKSSIFKKISSSSRSASKSRSNSRSWSRNKSRSWSRNRSRNRSSWRRNRRRSWSGSNVRCRLRSASRSRNRNGMHGREAMPKYSRWHDKHSKRGPETRWSNANTVPLGNRNASRNSATQQHAKRASSPRPCLKIMEGDSTSNERTTVVIRNIPVEYNADKLEALLDREGFSSEYDFLYMPLDFYTGHHYGYGFVNLISHECALKLSKHLQGFEGWFRAGDPDVASDKVELHKDQLSCAVVWAEKHQGLEKYIEINRNSQVMHHSVEDKFRPRLFRDGKRVPFPKPTKHIKWPHVRTNRKMMVVGRPDLGDEKRSPRRTPAICDRKRSHSRSRSPPSSRSSRESSPGRKNSRDRKLAPNDSKNSS